MMVSLSVLATVAVGDSPDSFAKAKRIATQVFQVNRITLYCQCAYDKKGAIDLASCGMNEAQSKGRAHRLEWEHMLPVEHFGQRFRCWRENLCEDSKGNPYHGRKYCEKIDPQFRHIEAELYNLWPAVGLVNQARSNYRYGMIDKKTPFYGCAIGIDKQNRRAEPPDWAKGIVARAHLFLADFYKLSLSHSQRKLYLAWHRQFPPSDWEKKWATDVAGIEGYTNPYILEQA